METATPPLFLSLVYPPLSLTVAAPQPPAPQAIQFVIAVSQVVIVQLGGSIMQTVPLTGWQWSVCVALGALSLVWGMIVKGFHSCLFPSSEHRLPAADRDRKTR